ncbi:MAG: ParB/RepB/Spo0J family partition protein [Oscillospiraceae bacterium]
MSEVFNNDIVLNQVVAVPLEYISANPNQPRKEIITRELEGLMQSINENGLIQPVSLRKISDKSYEIIAGERRCRACLELGYKLIPAVIQNVSTEKSAVLALVENLQRKNLDFFEEAVAINQLISQFHYNQAELGKILGKSQGAIANKLRLLKLSRDCVNIVINEGLTERHARALLKFNDASLQMKAVKHIVKYGLNVDQSEKYINAVLAKLRGEQIGASIIFVSDVRVFFNTLKEAIGFMKSAGINIKSEQTEDDEYINCTVRIPKSQARKIERRLNA